MIELYGKLFQPLTELTTLRCLGVHILWPTISNAKDVLTLLWERDIIQRKLGNVLNIFVSFEHPGCYLSHYHIVKQLSKTDSVA